tara:strand:+ start:108 stop:1214 length:1107 start_codon:yes stop_codon:yes gene_type:complete
MRIERIETNIKSDTEVSIDLATNTTIFHGPNGSGKTALINAVELALTGEARDLGTRSSAKSGVLLRSLIHDLNDSAYANVYLDNGCVFRWSLDRSSGAKQSKPPEIKVHFPLRDAETALSSGKEKTLHYLYRLCSSYKKSTLTELDQTKRKMAHSRQRVKDVALTMNRIASTYGIATLPDPLEGHSRLCEFPPEVFSLLLRLEVDKEKAASEHEVASLLYSRKIETLSEIIESNGADICFKINQYLPKGHHRQHESVSLVVTANNIRLGWITPSGKSMPFVSGAETIYLTAALGLAHTKEIGWGDSDLVIIICPDRSLDSTTIRSLRESLEHLPGHSFLQTASDTDDLMWISDNNLVQLPLSPTFGIS